MRHAKKWNLERLEDRDVPSTGLVAVGTDTGPTATSRLYDPDGTLRFQVEPFGSGFTGGARVAVGDVNGDGTEDLITASGPGGGPMVSVYSGVDGAELFTFFAFESAFTGGVYVAAADFDRDGRAELIVSPDQSGGPRVRVLKATDGLETVADFYVFESSFNGGVRVAVGDIDGSGTPDLVVSAGFGGGPRVAVIDGSKLQHPQAPLRLLPDFYVFEETLRNGAYVGSGELNGDGYDDLVFGGGPGGGPRVTAWDAQTLVQSKGSERVTIVDFFASDSALRGGVPVAVGDLNGDGRGEILAGSGPGGSGEVNGLQIPSLERVRTFAGTPASSLAGVFPSASMVSASSPSSTGPGKSNGRGKPTSPEEPPTSPPPAPGSTPPRISNLPDLAVQAGTSSGPVSFAIADDESPAGDLTVIAISSNTLLVPLTGIVLGGSGEIRTVTITPVAGQTGTVDVTLTVSDPGGLTAADTFSVSVYPPPPGSDSPTGRNPRLVWTSQQQAVWDRMRAENHPWWALVKNNADATGTANERYNDYGQWATLVYQATGDVAYAAKAWGKLSSWMGQLPSWGRNATREHFAEFVILYDWLYPALTPEQRTTFIDTLNMWGDAVLSSPATGWSTRTGDSDETVGHYFGLALLDVATGPDNPRAGTFLTSTWPESGGPLVPVGGLDSTGANRLTMRNAISDFVESAEGGQWIESGEYNQGTLKLLLMGVQGIRTATGVDHFPEVTRYLKQAALAQIHELSADLEASYQWGDEQRPRDITLYKRVTLLGMLGGFTQDDPQVGPYVNRLVADLVEKYGPTGWGSAEPWARLFLFYNPYAPQADWRTLPGSHFNSGTGILAFHDGWGADDSFFSAHMATRVGVDHEVSYFGDFQLYRDGEWVITRPLGYGGPAVGGESANSMLIGGLSSMASREVVAQAFGPGNSWAYVAGTTGGQYYAQPYWDPPPTFLHEWTRSLFYLPSVDGSADTVITFDRVDADNPETLPKLDRYYASERDAITSAAALKQWIIHTPVQPTLTADGISWTTAGGQVVQVSTLQPLNQTRTIYNEDELWPNPPYWNFSDSEKNYQVRIAPTTEQRWDTFLNVVQVSDPGTALTNVGVRSVGGEASGVLVQRGGLADSLVMFGAVQGTRILSTGYTVNWTAGAASTDLYLMDLDTTKKWSVLINDGPAVALSVSPEGIGQLSVAGSGAQKLQLIAV